MFLFVFNGRPDRCAQFKRIVRRHAGWLALDLHERRFELRGERLCHVVWLTAPGSPHAPVPHESADTFSIPADLGRHPIGFTLDTSEGESRFEVPLVGEEQLYYTGDEQAWLAATDLRVPLAWSGFRSAPLGLQSLLHYGMVPAPETIVSDVRRVPTGHRLVHDANGERVERFVPPIAEWTTPVEDREADDRFRTTLDRTLEATPENAVVFFSGGVDSGLIAARLAAAGRDDIRLVNYAFGMEDPESTNAEAMAQHLGLPFERVIHDESRIPAVTDRIGRGFTFPFNDLSVIPTQLMIDSAEETLTAGHAVLLGVGADDLYAGGLKAHAWGRVTGAPRWIRSATVGLLGASSPWWRSGRTTKTWSVLRRSLQADHEFGPLLMHTDLAGIAFSLRPEHQSTIEQAWAASYDAFSQGLVVEDRLAWIYLMNGGMGWEAPKFERLRHLGVRTGYPLLDGEMLGLGFSLSWNQKCGDTKDKILLNRLLAQSFPASMIDRPKAGFSPPFETLLQDEALQSRFRAALLDPGSALEGALHRSFVEQALDRARAGRRLGRTTTNVLWAGFFGSCWFEQVRSALA